MARRKKTDELEIEVESKEPTEESEATDDAEQLEQEALAEVDADDAVIAADEEEEKAPKPKRQRRPRKKKEAEPTLMASEPIAAPALAATPVAAVAPIAAPTEVFVGNPNTLREDATVADVSIHRSMDAMAKQWASVKDISTSVCSNLERVAGSLNDLETKYATASQELNKQSSQKSQLLNRIAVGASAMALVMSLLSLALSQSARQNALNSTAQAKMETAPLKSGFVAESPKTFQPPVLRETRKELPNTIARSPKLKAERKGSVRK